jgi:hypothetical protein
VYLHTRPTKNGRVPSVYRVAIPQSNESFYFNQESVKAIVYCDTNHDLKYRESLIASIHLTNKRLLLISQSSSIAPTKPTCFDTCEFQLTDFKSLKSKLTHRKGLRLDIKTCRNENICIELKFDSKKDANRRESLREYIKMATSAVLSGQGQCQAISQPQQQVWDHDDLPSYLEATTNNNISSIAPPAYS